MGDYNKNGNVQGLVSSVVQRQLPAVLQVQQKACTCNFSTAAMLISRTTLSEQLRLLLKNSHKEVNWQKQVTVVNMLQSYKGCCISNLIPGQGLHFQTITLQQICLIYI